MSIKHCRCMFATHYHSLLSDWEFDPRVKLGHMNCLVHDNSHDNDDEDDNDGGEGGGDSHDGEGNKGGSGDGEEVTFLYKLTDGSSPRSYGINVARLAGLPTAVITLALQQSRLFEDKMKKNNNSSQHEYNQNTDRNSSDDIQHRDYNQRIHVDKIRSVYERLVSLAGSTSSISELSSVAIEMWRRYQLLKTT